jgi:hypothetical protein
MRFLMTMAALAALLVRPVPVHATDPAPSPARVAPDADPAVRLAGAAARRVERDEAAWREQTARLAKAVEAYHPGPTVDPLPEDDALQAFRQYCTRLLESGREVAALHAKWADARVALADSLRKSPAYYRAAAKAMRERAGSARFPAVAEKYRLASDVWEQLALRAEVRTRDLGGDGEAGSVAALVAEENQFLEDFLKTLDALPRPTGAERGRYDELLAALRKQAARGDELQQQLRAFRDKLKVAPQPPEPTPPSK